MEKPKATLEERDVARATCRNLIGYGSRNQTTFSSNVQIKKNTEHNVNGISHANKFVQLEVYFFATQVARKNFTSNKAIGRI